MSFARAATDRFMVVLSAHSTRAFSDLLAATFIRPEKMNPVA
jgi:hypothetical protein